jgi:hypothetical protein
VLHEQSAWFDEGTLRRRSRGGARCGVPRRRLVTAGPGGPEIRPRRHYDRGCEEHRCTSFGGNAETGSAEPGPKIATVERREARFPAFGEVGISAEMSGVQVVARHGCASCTRRLSALRHPLDRGCLPAEASGEGGEKIGKARAQIALRQ